LYQETVPGNNTKDFSDGGKIVCKGRLPSDVVHFHVLKKVQLEKGRERRTVLMGLNRTMQDDEEGEDSGSFSMAAIQLEEKNDFQPWVDNELPSSLARLHGYYISLATDKQKAPRTQLSSTRLNGVYTSIADNSAQQSHEIIELTAQIQSLTLCSRIN